MTTTLRAENAGGNLMDFFLIRGEIVERVIQLHPNHLEARLLNSHVEPAARRRQFHADFKAQGWAEIRLLNIQHNVSAYS